jgi:hypothetical protein
MVEALSPSADLLGQQGAAILGGVNGVCGGFADFRPSPVLNVQFASQIYHLFTYLWEVIFGSFLRYKASTFPWNLSCVLTKPQPEQAIRGLSGKANSSEICPTVAMPRPNASAKEIEGSADFLTWDIEHQRENRWQARARECFAGLRAHLAAQYEGGFNNRFGNK